MSLVNTRTFNELVADQVTDQQAQSSAILDFTPGSILLAVAESNANVAVWLQSIFIQLLATTRAATSTGTDLDTWVADFGVSRLAPTRATGLATFSRFSSTVQSIVYPGSTLQTIDGTATYQVLADPAHAAWSNAIGGFVLEIGTASIILPIEALEAGSTGNVPAGTITVITTPIPGVDTVTNTAAIANGEALETDAALRIRFVEFIASLARATSDAVTYAVTSLQPGIAHAIVENYTYAGVLTLGNFYVVLDDGTGAPSADLLAKAQAAINAVRPLGSTFTVHPPVVLAANVSMALTLSSGTLATIDAEVKAAITDYLNALPLGTNCPYTILAQIAYNTSPLITNVTGITLNGATTDLVASKKQIIKSGIVAVN
jgi:uncharacterized phage protein gp47/JayE